MTETPEIPIQIIQINETSVSTASSLTSEPSETPIKETIAIAAIEADSNENITQSTINTVDTVDTVDIVNTTNTINTVDTADTINTVNTVNTANIVDTLESISYGSNKINVTVKDSLAKEEITPPSHSFYQVPPPPPIPNWIEQGVNSARNWLLGGNTVVRSGLILLFLGLAFLAKAVIGTGIIPIEYRLAAIAATGLVLLKIGFGLRLRRPEFGLSLQGGGIAILYLTVFGSFRLFGVTGLGASFGMMLLICAASVVLALLQNAPLLAFLAFAGGFATPLLLSTGQGNHIALFSYYAILNLAILIIAFKKSWRPLHLLAFFATFGVSTLWGAMKYLPEHYATTQPFLILFVLIFVITTLLYARSTPTWTGGKMQRTVDSTLVFGTPIAGFGLQASLVASFPMGAAFSAMAFSAMYLTLTFLLKRKGESYKMLAQCFFALGVGFVTLSIPYALGADWTSAIWALEGLGAFWVGMRQGRWFSRSVGMGLQGLGLMSFFHAASGWYQPHTDETFQGLSISWTSSLLAQPWLNPQFMSLLVLAVSALVLASWLRNSPLPLVDTPPPQEDHPSFMGRLQERLKQFGLGLETRLAQPFLFYGFAIWISANWLEILYIKHWQLDSLPRLANHLTFGFVEPFALPLLMVLVWLISIGALLLWGQRLAWSPPQALGMTSWSSLLVAWIACFLLDESFNQGGNKVIWLALWMLHGFILYRLERNRALPDFASWIPYLPRIHRFGIWLLLAVVVTMLWDDLHWNAWAKNSSWGSVILFMPFVIMMMFLTFWAGRAKVHQPDALKAFHWPLNPYAKTYLVHAASPIAFLTLFFGALLSIFSSGRTQPLPYLPLLNPTELSIVLSLLTIWIWHQRLQALSSFSNVENNNFENNNDYINNNNYTLTLFFTKKSFVYVLLGLLFVTLNTTWLRITHHYWHLDWDMSMLGTATVQAGFSLLWTFSAMGLMYAAQTKAKRTWWLLGAAILAVVVLKLMLIDLVQIGSIQRIIAFIGVGLAMLVIGYVAPLPPAQDRTTP